MTPLRTQLHHVALTVTDLDASVPWYEAVFGIRFVTDVPHEGGVGKLLLDEAGTLGLVLHRHDTNDGATFTETNAGLDHVGFLVANPDDLAAWQDHLEAQGITRAELADKPLTQSPITHAPYGAVLVFRDPDNIQLELFSPAAA